MTHRPLYGCRPSPLGRRDRGRSFHLARVSAVSARIYPNCNGFHVYPRYKTCHSGACFDKFITKVFEHGITDVAKTEIFGDEACPDSGKGRGQNGRGHSIMRVDTVNFSVDGLSVETSPSWQPTVSRRLNQPDDPVAHLTDGQRDCLRLVYRHMKSKDIARILGVSPHTVDMRLRTAMKTLAVASRIDAARMLVHSEGAPEAYQSLIYHAPELAGLAESAEMDAPASRGSDDQATGLSGPDRAVAGPLSFGPPRTADASAYIQTDRPGVGLPDPEVSTRPLVGSVPWGTRNDLSISARLSWILIIAIGSALAFGAILGALAALKTLV